jgi:2-hydroxychromene-2-carboxylate isomerase
MTPTSIPWYFDFISPFAYLHWPKVKALKAEGIAIVPRPILFAAVLDACGQKGPAEIPGKRVFTYRHVLWKAHEAGVPLRFPPAHPFNPLAALRLCIAAGASDAAIDAIFDWLWVQGRIGDSIDALAPIAAMLGLPADAANAPEVKAALRANTEAALAAGVFGVPTLQIGEALFWGDDAHDFARAVLRDPAVLDTSEMRRAVDIPAAVARGS